MLVVKGFTITEILISIVLVGLIAIAVASLDITSRQFFGSSEMESRIQDEAKIAMQHIVKHLQLGVGYLDSPGFSISGGAQLQVRLDDNGDGRFTGAPADRIIQYSYLAGQNKIVYDPDTSTAGDEQDLTDSIIVAPPFSDGVGEPNMVNVSIQVRNDPSESSGLDNPETTLTSSIVLRAMSCY